MSDLLGKILTDQPLCRKCSEPAFFNVGGLLLCPEHTFSGIAAGSSSRGEKVTAPAVTPPSRPGSLTDNHTNTFRVAANSGIQVQSDA